MRFQSDHVKVWVPATSANLGPGFDALGLALDLWDEIEARATTGPSRVTVIGEGAGQLPLSETHLVVRAAHEAFDIVGAPPVGLELLCRNRIPQTRGLGSSAAAVVAGALIARGMIEDPRALSSRVIFELAAQFEGHPDNAAPAVLGGATVAWTADGMPRCAPVPVAGQIAATVLIPEEVVATALARRALPAKVPFADATFNAGRAALLVCALGGAVDLLMDATEDKLHQPYRAMVMPFTLDLVASLREEGIPAIVSGAGPSVLLLTNGPIVDLPVDLPAGWRAVPLDIATGGGRVARIKD